MRVQLSIACLMAATMAVELSKVDTKEADTLLAQASASCFPNIGCGCGCGEEDQEEIVEEKDGHMETEVDVVEAAVEDVEELGDEVMEDAQLEEKLADVVGEHEAEAIVDDVIEPIVETEILNDETHVDDIVEAIEEVIPQEEVQVEDPVPETEEVVEELEQEVIPDHEEVTVLDTPEDLGINDEDLENAEIVEITDPAGDEIEVIIIDNPTDVPPAKDEEEGGDLEVVEVVEEEPAPAEGDGSGVVEETVVEEEEPVPEVPDEVVEEEIEEIVEATEEAEEPVVEETVEEVVEETVEEVVEEVVEEEPVVEEPVDDGVYQTTVPEPPALTAEEEDACAGDVRCVLNKLLDMAEGRPLVLDFQYDACSPCQDIAPEFEAI